MGKEIEKKFLVKREMIKSVTKGIFLRQGYISIDKKRTVRVRIAENKAYITVKGISTGAVRDEYEYEIPVRDANEILDKICITPIIEKKRVKLEINELTWEIDSFYGDNEGLIIAEVELKDEEQTITKPDWAGKDVTGDPKYFNSNLVKNPYKNWGNNSEED